MIVKCSSPIRRDECSGCGLPPRERNGIVMPLRSCSRCKQAFYHDVDCQRKHFQRHRRVGCKPITTTAAAAFPSGAQHNSQQRHQVFRVEQREGKGACLVATTALKRGDIVLQAESLVPPVLRLEQSMQRCAVCFGKLQAAKYQFEGVPHHSRHHPVYLCSRECLSASSSWLSQEEQFIYNILDGQQNRKVRVFTSTILLYRIVRAITVSTEIRRQLENLQQHDPLKMDETERIHTKAVVSVTQLLLRQDPDTKLRDSEYTFEFLAKILTKMKTNGFSIADGESIPIGMGLYREASFANHSCSPNALQTFVYGNKGQSPVLRVTVCDERGISPDEEICISYIESSVPRVSRQKLLQNTYYFQCCCPRCTPNGQEPRGGEAGVRCQYCQNCSVVEVSNNDDFHCLDCGTTNFDDAKQAIQVFQDHPSNAPWEEQLKLFASFQRLFRKDSWYYQECGQRCFQALLDKIGCCENDMDSMRLCHQALTLGETLLVPGAKKDWSMLHSVLLKYKCAKLRLAIQNDPCAAIGELQECLRELLIFYPENHEVILDLKATLSEAFM